MIPIELFTPFYFLGLSIFILFFSLELTKYRSFKKIPYHILSFFSFILLVYTVLFIGLRDPYASSIYLGDTSVYTLYFESIHERDLTNEKEYGFYLLMKLLFPFGIRVFYIFCALIYVILPYISFRKFFGKYAFFAVCMFITSMSFWGFGINGLRSGLASSIFLFGLSFYSRKAVMFSILWLSTLFHNSMYLPLLCFIGMYFFNDSKKLLFLWLMSILIALLVGEQINNFLQNFFQIIGFQDRRTDGLFDDVEELKVFKTGFRFDFVLYSAIPIITGYIYIYKRNFRDKFYIHLYNAYILCNMVWIIMMYAPFSNRTAYLSWFLMPLLIIFPLMKNHFIIKNKKRLLIYTVLASLIFSIIMQFK